MKHLFYNDERRYAYFVLGSEGRALAKRKLYDDKFRASAVIMLEAAGYPQQQGALTRTASELKVPARTLSRWFNREQNPPPDQLVSIKRGDMVESLDDIQWKLLNHLKKDDVIEEMSGRDAATSYGIITDKRRLLEGLPTQIVEMMPLFNEAMRKAGLDPIQALQTMIERANQVVQ